MCMNVLSICMSVHHAHAWFLMKSEKSIRSPGAEVTDGFK